MTDCICLRYDFVLTGFQLKTLLTNIQFQVLLARLRGRFSGAMPCQLTSAINFLARKGTP